MQKHLSDFSLKGPIRSFSEKTVEVSHTTCNPYINTTCIFDYNGYLIKRITDRYGLGYSESTTILFEYDKFHSLVKETELMTDDNYEFGEKYNKKISLFKHGKILKITLQLNEKVLSEKTYKYHKNGLKKEILEKYLYSYKNPPLYDEHFNVPPSLKENLKKIQEEFIVEHTVYDTNGNIVLESKKGLQNDFRSKLASTYDKKGNLIKKMIYKNDKEISKKVLFKYDILKKRVEKKEYNDKDVLLVEELIRYNSKGDEIEKIEYFYKESNISIQITTNLYGKDDQLTEMIFITHDHNGKVKEERHKLPVTKNNFDFLKKIEDKKISEYDYDIYGNWIAKRIKSINSNKQTIYTRNIIYEQ